MNQPREFENQAQPEYVCKLRKTLYCLKQAPRVYYGKITKFLIQSGYSVAHVNSRLFVKDSKGKLATMLVYMDELILAGDNEEKIRSLREKWSVHFQMKKHHQLKHFLGLQVDQTEDGIFLCQQKYAKDLLKKFGMLECKLISIPWKSMQNRARMKANIYKMEQCIDN